MLDAGPAWIVATADGTGGIAGGGGAADAVIAGVRDAVTRPSFDPLAPAAWSGLLVDLDGTIHRARGAGETTAVVMAVTASDIVGASCGDSQAWLLGDAASLELTKDQSRKPRLGTGRAAPKSFCARPDGVLLVGTDGLFDHATRADITTIVLADPDAAADALLALLRAKFRSLPDDVAIVVGLLG